MSFQSNQRETEPKTVSVSQKNDTSYAFNINVQLLLGEIIKYYVDWTAEGRVIGSYIIGVSAFSDDPDVDLRFRSCQDTREVQILQDTPEINEPILSQMYHPSGLDPQEMYVYPGQNIDVRCNISCPIGVKNVSLYYSVDSGGVWNQSIMAKNSGNEWMGTVPGQSEGKVVTVYVETFSLTGKSSKTREYACRVSDLQLLELRTRIVTAATVTTILIGFIGIFALKRRKMTEAF